MKILYRVAFSITLSVLSVSSILVVTYEGQVRGISAQDSLGLEMIKRTTWKSCPAGHRVRRCDYGQGNCIPSMQTLCDHSGNY